MDCSQLNRQILGLKMNRIRTERDFGIKAYIQKGQAVFSGIIKHRFSDFLVNEVDLQGNVINSRPHSLPATAEPQAQLDTESALAALSLILPDTNALAQIREYLDGQSQTRIVTAPIAAKALRTSIHQELRRCLGGRLQSVTEDECIVITPKSKAGDRRETVDYKQLGGEYCHFTLYKENMDTMEALNLISRYIRRSTKTFTFAGTKDKRAITCQRISAHRVESKLLLGLNQRIRGLLISDTRHLPTRLSLGDLSGNRFVITLRDVQCESESTIGGSMESFKANGFINYYGMQRFGTRVTATSDVGIAILADEWEKAVDIIMMPKPDEPASLTNARKTWLESKDAKACIKLFPKRLSAEQSILRYFSSGQRANDYLGALTAIPRQLRLMYVHAYQSLVWNEMATQRIELYGYKPVVGDIVISSSDSTGATGLEAIPSDGESVVSDGGRDSNLSKAVLIESEEQCNLYSMTDVVLPLPGTSVVYPSNAIREKYVEFMAKHGFNPFEMKRKVREFSLRGSYRHVVVMPKDVSWKTFRYNDDAIPLSRSDLAIVKNEPEPSSIEDGASLALVVEFTLPSSAYATMALREIMKTETSAGFQKSLSSKRVADENDEQEAKRRTVEDNRMSE